MPADQLHWLQTALVSGRPHRMRQAIEMPRGQTLRGSFVRELHRLSLHFEPASATRAGFRQVRVLARVSGPTGTKVWQVTLDRIHGRYLLATTKIVR